MKSKQRMGAGVIESIKAARRSLLPLFFSWLLLGCAGMSRSSPLASSFFHRDVTFFNSLFRTFYFHFPDSLGSLSKGWGEGWGNGTLWAAWELWEARL